MQSNKVITSVQVILEMIAAGLLLVVKGITRPFTYLPFLVLSVIPTALVFMLLAFFEGFVGDLTQQQWFDSQMQFEAFLDGAAFVFAMFLAANITISLVAAFCFGDVWISSGDRKDRAD
jgi:hypothetical protein